MNSLSTQLAAPLSRAQIAVLKEVVKNLKFSKRSWKSLTPAEENFNHGVDLLAYMLVNRLLKANLPNHEGDTHHAQD